ncbi:MAG: B12-binding domain-containing protein, partial [Ignisphaera sp.]|nr:B12-binding domain-containing protein [Ignisphaera sp.]
MVSLSQEFVDAIVGLDEKRAIELAKRRLEVEDPQAVLGDLRVAADVIGSKFECGDYFVADLVMAGEILKAISDMVREK